MKLTINALAAASTIDRRTWQKWLLTESAEDGKYTLTSVLNAILKRREYEVERLAKLKAERELAEQELGESKGRLLDVQEYLRQTAPLHARMVAIIENSKLTDAEKFDLRTELAKEYEISLENRRKAEEGNHA